MERHTCEQQLSQEPSVVIHVRGYYLKTHVDRKKWSADEICVWLLKYHLGIVNIAVNYINANLTFLKTCSAVANTDMANRAGTKIKILWSTPKHMILHQLNRSSKNSKTIVENTCGQDLPAPASPTGSAIVCCQLHMTNYQWMTTVGDSMSRQISNTRVLQTFYGTMSGNSRASWNGMDCCSGSFSVKMAKGSLPMVFCRWQHVERVPRSPLCRWYSWNPSSFPTFSLLGLECTGCRASS